MLTSVTIGPKIAAVVLAGWLAVTGLNPGIPGGDILVPQPPPAVTTEIINHGNHFQIDEKIGKHGKTMRFEINKNGELEAVIIINKDGKLTNAWDFQRQNWKTFTNRLTKEQADLLEKWQTKINEGKVTEELKEKAKAKEVK